MKKHEEREDEWDDELDDIFAESMKFHEAQHKAEEKGETDFICPICGGHASWRKFSNGNKIAECNDCGYGFVM